MLAKQLMDHLQTPCGMILVGIIVTLIAARYSPQVAGYLYKGLTLLAPSTPTALTTTDNPSLTSSKKLLQAAMNELEANNLDIATQILNVFVGKSNPLPPTKEDYSMESAEQLLASASAEMKAGHITTANEIMQVFIKKTTVPTVGATDATKTG